MRKYLKPEEAPSAEFPMEFSEDIIAREYCNIHGLWANRK
jgi:superoxide reductase